MDEITVTEEGFSDENSPFEYKIDGINLTPVEMVIVSKINELVAQFNRLDQRQT